MMDDGHRPGIQSGQVESGQRFSQALSLSIYSKTLLIKQEAVIFFFFFLPDYFPARTSCQWEYEIH